MFGYYARAYQILAHGIIMFKNINYFDCCCNLDLMFVCYDQC